MRSLGTLVRLQIQTEPLKEPVEPRRYAPERILAVPALRLTVRGAFGRLEDGSERIDVHHRDHPRSRHSGDNPLSVGFTGHHAAMRARFGAHMADGIAGESFLVACDRTVAPEELAAGLWIRTAGGDLVPLAPARPAAPCAPFSRFCLGLAPGAGEPEAVKEALRFLSGGTRGFYTTLAREAEAVVAVGDEVLAP